MSEAIGIVADTKSFKKMASNFRKASPQSYRAAQKVLRAIALAVYTDAKGRSSFSSRISGSGKVRMSGLNAKIDFGGGSAYIAVPIENAGKGFVEHLTFGHEPLTSKNSHPAFLMPSFEAHVVEYVEALKVAVRDATDAALG